MAGPWEAYQNPSVAPAIGPWNAYQPPSPAAPPAEVSTMGDVGRSLLGGVERGLAEGVGSMGDLRDLAERGTAKIGLPKGAGESLVSGLIPVPLAGSALTHFAPTSSTVEHGIEHVAGPIYEPQTTAGKFARTAGEFLPAAFLPGGGEAKVVERLGKMVLAPALASEAAGQLTEGTALEPYARMAGAALAPGSGARVTAAKRATALVPRTTQEIAGVEVPLSRGQASGNIIDQTLENAARRGARGEPAREEAEAFFGGAQEPAVERARQTIGEQLDPNGRSIINSPHDAADMVSTRLGEQAASRQQALAVDAQNVAQQHEALRTGLSPTGGVLANSPYEAADFISNAVGHSAEQARAAYTQAYDQLAQLPGQFHPAAFNRIGDSIRGDLNRGAQPIRIDAQTTPIASGALHDLDEILSGIHQTRDELGRVQPREPVTPALVDYARKRLNSFYGDAINNARATNNFSDVRAMRGIMDGFDDAVAGRLRAGTYMGGDAGQVTQAMDRARGLYSQYRRTFTRQGAGDQVGPILEQIVGKHEGQAAPPEQIQQWMYGNGAIPVKLAQRLVNVFGANSPEVGAVKQGLLSHLTEPTPGREWNPQQVADRIRGFMTGNGRTLSQIYLSAPERQQLSAFADRLERHANLANAPQDSIDRIIGHMSGANGIPASTTEILNHLQGASGQGNRALSEQLIGRLRTQLGENSPEWHALRQAQWERLSQAPEGVTEFGPQKASNRISNFLNGPGRPIAEALYSPKERQIMSNYATLLKQITPKPGSVNHSGTGVMLKTLKSSANSIAVLLGAAVGGPVGAVIGHAAGPVATKLKENAAAKSLRKSFYQPPPGRVSISPPANWQRQALINAAMAGRTDESANR